MYCANYIYTNHFGVYRTYRSVCICGMKTHRFRGDLEERERASKFSLERYHIFLVGVIYLSFFHSVLNRRTEQIDCARPDSY